MSTYIFFQNILPDGYVHHITSFQRHEDVRVEVTNFNKSVIIIVLQAIPLHLYNMVVFLLVNTVFV